jgi:FkbH-like protein
VVRDALERHPEMLLKPNDFAATRVNWGSKSKSLRDIAEELNIGLDSLVFFDDNPVERAEVRQGAPEVHVVEVPTDPSHYVTALSQVPAFDAPVLTAEDRLRAQSYEAQVERKRLEEESGSSEEFLSSLEMQVEVGRWDALSAQRITQLVAKTNQFNTTTRRLGEAELAAIDASGPGVYWLRLADKYGDMGLVGVWILTSEAKDVVVHGLVLSCRAANRGIEQTMLAHAAAKARGLGYERLVGEFIASRKNAPVAELYPRLGFARDSDVEGVTRYVRDLGNDELAIPDFIRLRESSSGQFS